MKIDEKTLKETVHCKNKFNCLKKKNHVSLIPKVYRNLNESILFVNCTASTCFYKIDYGKSAICTCPTRKEIYKKFKM
jgi:hypothetical protein